MIEDNNFGAELLHKIKDGKAPLRPRWLFIAKNCLIWGLGGISLFLGAISISLIIYMLVNSDMEAYDRMGGHLWEKIMLSIPLFWTICLILFAIVVLYDIRHTKHGYRYSPLLIMTGITASSVILGGLFYAGGVGRIIDGELGRRAPYYDRIINPRIGFWSNPDNGRLIGIIEGKTGEYEYILIDRNQNEWTVMTEDAEIGPDVEMEMNLPVRMMGEVLSDNVFQASIVFSMLPPGREFFDRFGHDRLPRQGGFNGIEGNMLLLPVGN